jgi:hypothetical protein
MTLVFNSRRPGPQTHVLIIGVGGYRHLAGHPAGLRMRDPYAFGGLGQLTSPPRSALELIDLFAGSDPGSWQAPLGTVDALISPHPADPQPRPGMRFAVPTMANIERAFDAWWRRCDRNPGNVAILYFCGHGIEGDEQYLLASDFGANEQRPWSNAIAIDSTIKGLWHNRAQTQCVFIDACREVTPAIGSTPRIDAPALAVYDRDRERHNVYDLVLKAVATTERAFASPSTAAYFTKALRRALEGAAAEEDDVSGEWLVTTASIAAKIHDILAEEAPHRPPNPQPQPGRPVMLRRPPGPPVVKVLVDCDPAAANNVASMSCQSSDDPGLKFERGDPEPTTWEVPVPAGYYTLTACFEPESGYREARRSLLASPPTRRPKLRVM